MISIKHFLEPPKAPVPDADIVEALMQMARMLLDAIRSHTVRGNEKDFASFRSTFTAVARQMEGPRSVIALQAISSNAAQALETYYLATTEYFREQNRERHAVVAMLTETVAEISGQTDESVARLQTIEKQIAQASELDDIRALRESLDKSLRAVREAAVRQKSTSVATLERLRGQIAIAQAQIPVNPQPSRADDDSIDIFREAAESPGEPLAASYVAAFRLQRSEHIANRFGDKVKLQMLSMIASQLKALLGPNDRLLRWKGVSFVMFIHSPESSEHIRSRILQAIAKTGQQYIEVGSKSVLLSIGVDWTVFPRADRQSLESIYTEVDAFLANSRPPAVSSMAPR